MDRVEFVLAEAQEPHLFVIRKQIRQSPHNKAAVQAYYYVLGFDGYTYQAPSLHATITARLRRSMHHVKMGFNKFQVRDPRQAH